MTKACSIVNLILVLKLYFYTSFNPSREAMTVSQLAEVLDEKPVAVIKFLMTDLGVMAAMTQLLDPATCIAVTEGMGKVVAGSDEDDDEDDDEE